jgi:hypothetical protein
MQSYDKIGQIHRQQGNIPQAEGAFRLGLNLAEQLSYRTEYFAEQIQQLNQPAASQRADKK